MAEFPMVVKVGFEFEIATPPRGFIWGDWSGIFVALPEREAHRLHSVMTASTWGALQQQIDAAEYEELISRRFDDGNRPLLEDPFEPPTVELGDFDDPRALMLEWLPADVLALGEVHYTPEGEIFQLDISHAEIALSLLANAGWSQLRDDAAVKIWMGG